MAFFDTEDMSMPRSSDLENDPDYEAIHVNHRAKELEVLKQDAKEATICKIQSVINACFSQEIANKESELDDIQKNLMKAKTLMDHLRACIVTKYYYQEYFKGNEETDSQDWLHPKVKEYTGKMPRYGLVTDVHADHDYPRLAPDPLENDLPTRPVIQETRTQNETTSEATVRENIKLVVGNISKYILTEERNSVQDQATHKWMIYVRPQDSSASENHLISRIVVFLHPSYKPNDLVEISKPPFCVCRRGWGEFPVRVQIHFHDSRNKAVDVIHQLKLDKTFTGLQTLGGETVVEVPLYTSRQMTSTKSTLDTTTDHLNITSKNNQVNNVLRVSISKQCSSAASKDSTLMKVDTEMNHGDDLMRSECISSVGEDSYTLSVTNNTFLPTKIGDDLSSSITVKSNHVYENSVHDAVDSDMSSCVEIPHNTSLKGSGDETKEQLIKNIKQEDLSPTNYVPSNAANLVNSVLPDCKNVIQSSLVHESAPCVKTNFINNSYFRIVSATPIQITIKPKATNSSSCNSDIVHYFKPNVNGECLVPVSLLKPFLKNESQNEPPSISWNSKAIKFKQKLKIFVTHFRVHEYASLHEIMLKLMKLFPLISKDPYFSYCALSEAQFQSWTIGRKLAAEWARSRDVQKALTNIIKSKLITEKPWTVKEIFKWARKYGYTPVTVSHENCSEEALAGPSEICGLTSSECLLNCLESQQSSEKDIKVNSQRLDDELGESIDVETLVKQENVSHNQCVSLESQSSEKEEKLFVNEVLMKVCKDAITDILHQSLGESATRLKTSSPSISCADVYSAIQNLSFCDFLTNKNMGIEQL